MKPLLALSIVATALGLGLSDMSPAHAGACGPGMGPGQTAGTLAGAAAGGVIGNQFGKGSGKDVATVAGILAGGLVGNQAGESIDAQNCAPPAQPVVVVPAAPPPVVYQPAPVVAYPPPPPAYPPPTAYIVDNQVTWGEPVYMAPGRDCRAYSQWGVVNGTMQPVYGVACRDYYGWRYERPYEGAWRINLEFDHDHGFDHDRFDHDRFDHDRFDHDDHGHDNGHHH